MKNPYLSGRGYQLTCGKHFGRTPSPVSIAPLPDKERSEDQRDNRHQLNQDVHRRTGRVLKGISDGIPHDGGPVCFRTLSSEVPLLNVFCKRSGGYAAFSRFTEGADSDIGSREGGGCP